MKQQILPHIDIAAVLSSLNLEEETKMVVDAYHNQGFDGEFGQTAHFEIDTTSAKNPAAILHTPAYTPFLLYGRGPGKMPPLEPIESWMEAKGLTGSSFAIRKHIADFGTPGNDFLSPVLGQVKESIVQKVQNIICSAISSK